MMCKGRDDDALMLGRNIDVVQVIVFFASGCAKQDSRRAVVSINTVARFAVARFVKTVARPKVIAAGVIFTTLLLLLLVVLLLVIVIVNVVLVVIVLLPITWEFLMTTISPLVIKPCIIVINSIGVVV